MSVQSKELRWLEVGGNATTRLRVHVETIDPGGGLDIVEALRFAVPGAGSPLMMQASIGGVSQPSHFNVAVDDLRELIRLYDEERERHG